MKITRLENKPVEVTMDITCDICGKSCWSDPNFEYLFMCTNWGYGSKHDCQSWSAEICESCVMEKLEPLIKFQKEYEG